MQFQIVQRQLGTLHRFYYKTNYRISQSFQVYASILDPF